MGTTWSDVSEYQGIPVDDSYPHRVFCFRTNSGDKTDTLAVENTRRALDMLKRGRLDAVFSYYFFRPGQANCDLHREILTAGRLWGAPCTASMIDVEDANGAIRGDQSAEVNDEAKQMVGWYGLDQRRVFGYWNPVSNGALWRTRPSWVRLVVPSYGRTPGQPHTKPPGFFAHQYTDTGQCAPWPNGVDLNYTDLELPELLASFGFQGGVTVGTPEDVQQQLRGPELKGWEQLGQKSLVDGVADIRDQLGGPDHQWGGWTQLSGLTVVDALAAIGEHLGIAGFKAPPKGGK